MEMGVHVKAQHKTAGKMETKRNGDHQNRAIENRGMNPDRSANWNETGRGFRPIFHSSTPGGC